jgi:hypothetical protein
MPARHRTQRLPVDALIVVALDAVDGPQDQRGGDQRQQRGEPAIQRPEDATTPSPTIGLRALAGAHG